MGTLADLKVVEIFNTHGTTRKLAAKFSVSILVISQIKNGRGPFQVIISDYKKQALLHIQKGRFGCDPDYKIFQRIRQKQEQALDQAI